MSPQKHELNYGRRGENRILSAAGISAPPSPPRSRESRPPLTYGSVCSGIEAASMAWSELGWRASFFSEIDPFCRSVLQQHYPDVPLHDDFTTIQDGDYEPIDLLVGGTPCQAFSIAGLRMGLADERGNLSLEFVRLAERLRSRWLVWENVPGVLSVDGGRAFGTFLGGLAAIGYGVAYRVLDAQFFGVPQRRRRVFVVGYLGDWRRAAAVLFERQSLSGHPPPRRSTGAETAGTIMGGTAGGGWRIGADEAAANHVIAQGVALRGREGGCTAELTGEISIAFSCKDHGGDAQLNAAPTLRAMGHVGSQPNAGGQLAVAIPILEAGARTGPSSADMRAGIGVGQAGDPMFTLQAGKQHAVAVHENQRGEIRVADALGALSAGGGKPGQGYPAVCVTGEITHTLKAEGFDGSEDGTGRGHPIVAPRPRYGVRRLTPKECERLQGFPDGFTLVNYRGKPAADGPRYRSLGNSMAVPVMRWIGERIALIESMTIEAATSAKPTIH